MDADTRSIFKNLIGCFALHARNQGLALGVISQNLVLDPEQDELLKRHIEETLKLAEQMREASSAL